MAIEQIEEEEGFRAEKYSAGGKWYIGYGTECGEEDFPDGVTREEAELLLMSKVERYEEKLNDFLTATTSALRRGSSMRSSASATTSVPAG